jgi:hypothetical protein
MIGIFPKLARYRTESSKIATHLVLAIIGLALSLIFRIYSPAFLGAFLASIALTALLRVLLPPSGVYLASSNPDRIHLFTQLSFRTISQIAALLEVSNLVNPNGPPTKFFIGAVGVLNDYRTSNPADWTSVVGQLIETSAVVLVDGRDETPGLRYEVERIIRNRVDFKVIFISADGSFPPVLRNLKAKSTHPSGKFQIMTPEMALQVVPLMIRDAHSYWIPVHMDA